MIANNKLDDVIKNRDLLTDKINSDLRPLLKGWGMWLERVDIKDVRICSGTLFQDLQAEFKTIQQKDATIKRETSRNELTKETMKRELVDLKRNVKQEEERVHNEIRMRTDAIKKERDAYKTQLGLDKRTKTREIERAIFNAEQEHEKKMNQMKNNLTSWKVEQENSIKLTQSKQEKIKNDGAISL